MTVFRHILLYWNVKDEKIRHINELLGILKKQNNYETEN